MMDVRDIRALTEELRDAFDSSFKDPPASNEVETLDLVRISVGDKSFGVPIAELGGIRRCPPLTPVPGGAPGVSGVVGVRGELVVVVSLAVLLEEATDLASANWLLFTAHRSDVGLSCSGIEEYRRIAEADISRAGSDSNNDGHRIGVYNKGQEPFEIISVKRWIQEVAAAAGAPSERSQTQ